jgi:hypothetical protein
MRNIQNRELAAPADRVGALIDRLAGPDDILWPAREWPAMRFDKGLTVGARGGHGPIRYSVAEYVPGRRVRFEFDPRIGVTGHHEVRVEPLGAERCRLVHELVGRTHGRMILGWPLMLRWLHEALIQDLLDNAERAVAGEPRRPARWSWWVRLLRRVMGRRRPAAPLRAIRQAPDRASPGA